MSFFGSGSGTTGFTGFGSPNQQQQQQQQQQIRFGTPVNPTPAGGFTFGQAATTPAAGTSMFGAVQPQQPQPVANTGFTFASTGNPTAPAGSGFSFGTLSKPAETISAPGFSFGTAVAPAAASTSFGSGFGAPNVIATSFGTMGSTPATEFSFDSTVAPAPTTAVGFGAAIPPVTTSTTPFGYGFGVKPPTGTGGLTTTSTPGNLSFGQSATAPISAVPAAAPSFGFTGLTSTPTFGAPAATTTSSFGFGNSQTSLTPTIPLPTAPAVAATSTPSSFGSALSVPASNATFGFVGAAAAAAATSVMTAPQNKGFTFASVPTPAAQPTAGFQLGSGVTITPLSTAASLAPAPTVTPTSVFPSFGLAKPASTTGPGTTLASGLVGITSLSTAAPASGGFSLSLPVATPTASLTAAAVTSSAAPIAFGLSSTTAAPTTTSSATGFAFGATAAKPAATGFLTSSTTGATATPTTLLLTTNASAATAAPSTTALTTAPALLPASTAAATSIASSVASVTVPVPAAAAISFKKFEEDINKWTLELEEQEKVFLTQATQVNAWDRVLISNGEKITLLNDALERIKLDQEHLDQEIDFIRSQQSELEVLLEPLEKSVESMPTISVHQHADLEREQTFQTAENIDSQLRLMSKDLKEIIEHLNSSSGSQDPNDPIQQIGKILNSHMDSLEWIDQNTGLLRNKIDEVARVYDSHRQDQQDKGLRLPYRS